MTRRIAAADCETDPFKRRRVPRPFLWGIAERVDGWVEYRQFRTTDEFVDYISNEDMIVYAHNGGRFDWHFVLDHLEEYTEIMLIAGRIAKVRIGRCELRDSYNLIAEPLSAYKKDDIDYKIMEAAVRHQAVNWRKITKYLKSDCVYLLELVETFISEYGMHLTQAGAAMKQWQRISGTTPKTDGQFYEDLSDYYYGGRVECFESGTLAGEFDVFDVTSAYPAAMLEKHPYSENYEVRSGYAAGADFYRVRCISAGALPYRGLGGGDGGTSRGGLSFPSDTIRRDYAITKWEFEAGQETGALYDLEVIESVTFMGHTDFSDYIWHFFDKRAEYKAAGDTARSLFCKRMMNALYGKFAANPDEYKNYMVVPMDVAGSLHRAGWAFAGELGPWALAQSDLQEERQRFYNIATGASITGYQRAVMWRAIIAAKRAVYCDTDSLMKEGRDDTLTLGEKLGQWKHEGAFDRVGISGKKMYIMRGARGWWSDENGKTVFKRGKKPKKSSRLYKTAHKGVRMTRSQLWLVARGGTVNYVPEAPTFSPRKKPTFNARTVKFTA